MRAKAPADTRALIENHARQNAAFASKLEAAGALSLADMQPNGPSADLELRTLRQTRRFIFLRAVFCASGILFTLLPLVFTFDDRGVEFLLLGHQPGLVWSFWTIAAACWTACYAMHRQVRQSGLLVDGTCATVMEDRNAYSCVDVETCGFELSFERCLRDAMIMI